MIKKIIGSAVLWLAVWLGLSAFTIYCSSLIGLAVTVIWFAVPLVTFIMNLAVRKRLDINISVPVTMSKQRAIYGTLNVKNNSIISVPKIYCKLKITNRLTKAVTETVLTCAAASSEENAINFEIQSSQCGYLILEVSKCYLMDWIGFLPIPCICNAVGKVSVLPDTFAPGISLSLSATAKEDADNWSPYKKGMDQTEVFALRDYVPGDSLKQIHWKLSSKKQQLIVREPSLPIEKSLLIFWDKNAREASAKEMDAMAECMASVCQEILNQGTTFTVGWTEEKLCAFESIDTEDQLLTAIPRMLKHGADVSSGSGAFLNTQTGMSGSFGKVIYVAGTYPEDFEPFSDGELSLILCGKKEESLSLPAVLFDADTYEEDLGMIEL